LDAVAPLAVDLLLVSFATPLAFVVPLRAPDAACLPAVPFLVVAIASGLSEVDLGRDQQTIADRSEKLFG
jgi:hypothetical protein